MIPTFILSTLLYFTIIEIVPNGPVEVYLQNELSKLQMSGEDTSLGVDTGMSPADAMNDEDVVNRLKRYFGIDKPFHVRYLNWLGILPREMEQKLIAFSPGQKKMKYRLAYKDSLTVEIEDKNNVTLGKDSGDVGGWKWKLRYPKGYDSAVEHINNNNELLIDNGFSIDAKETDIVAKSSAPMRLGKQDVGRTLLSLTYDTDKTKGNISIAGVSIINNKGTKELEEEDIDSVLSLKDNPEDGIIRIELLKPLKGKITELDITLSNVKLMQTFPDVKIYKSSFKGIITGHLGKSHKYKMTVNELISDRIHISAYFGLVSMVLTYLICIPLGIYKAIKNGSTFDMLSSVIVFIGYSVPGFLLGALLLIYLGGGSYYDIFPLGEFRSDHWEYLTFWQKINNQLHHSTIPFIAWMVGAFATLTVMMKNSLLENLSQDYVRTAFAKGLSERRVIFMHAVRNSLIPIATGIGGLLGVWLAGSYILEKVFNIDGIGMLAYNAIIDRDYPIVTGFMAISLTLRLLGNLISDICYAAIDPRIRFK